MAKKIIDITEKLSFEENPILVIKGKELEVNTDAETVLKLMGIIGDQEDTSQKEVLDMYELIFPEDSRKAISELSLSFNDLKLVIQEAMSLITEEDHALGEQ